MARRLTELELGRLFYSVGYIHTERGWSTRKEVEENRFKLEIMEATNVELNDIELYILGFVLLLVLARVHPLRRHPSNGCQLTRLDGGVPYQTRRMRWLGLCFDCDKWIIDRTIYPDPDE